MLYYRQVPNLSQTNLNEIYASQTASIERGGHPDIEFLHWCCKGPTLKQSATVARMRSNSYKMLCEGECGDSRGASTARCELTGPSLQC